MPGLGGLGAYGYAEGCCGKRIAVHREPYLFVGEAGLEPARECKGYPGGPRAPDLAIVCASLLCAPLPLGGWLPREVGGP